MTYRVARVQAPASLSIDWNSEFWRGIEPLQLRSFMGERPEHFPQVQAKVAYSDDALYVIFRVDDQYVRAVAREHQGAVWEDSCVEFFFTPGEDISQGYFNLEMNCGGTMLLHYQRIPREGTIRLAEEDVARIEVAHTMPKIVEPEITDPVQWSVAYRLPVSMFSRYFPARLAAPAPGAIWKANFYKCADATSHPHWLTWSPVEHDQPDFHRPQSFGTLIFE